MHLVINNVSEGMPLWLNEGLAEYYSTFQVEDSGRRALIGRAIPSHLQLLNVRRLLTIPELLAVDQSSLAYNEGERQTLFYAQSWALVHMLVAGTTNGAKLLSQYARLASNGMPSLDAWQQIFKDQNITRQLESYVQQDVMTAVIYRFDQRIPPVKSYSSVVSEGDVQAVLGDLLRRVAEAPETTARFEKAIALTPPSARARALFGLLLLDLPNGGEANARARALLLEAATDTTDWLVQYHVATGLTRIATTADERDPLVIATARAALERVLAARPELANAHALGARLDAEEDDDVPRALDAIRRARKVSPGREDYMLLEAFILMRRGEYVAARQMLTPLTTPRYSAQVRENASAVLEQVARLEHEAIAYRAALEGQRAIPEPAAGQGRLVPLYRRVQPGEHRVQGLLERIDCTDPGIVLHVNVEGTIERFAAPSMTGVAFISHREDLRGGIDCSPRTPPDRVYVTWREDDSPGRTRRVVAVEFLPKPR